MRTTFLLVLCLLLAAAALADGLPGAGGPPPAAERPVAVEPMVRPLTTAYAITLGGAGMWPPNSAPALALLEGKLFIVLGNAVYKLDPATMQVLGVAVLPPPPPLPPPGQAQPLQVVPEAVPVAPR